MPAMLGYFAAMLHNSNQLTIQCSTATTLLELQVGRDLCAMVGFPESSGMEPWSHITAGGSIAIIEAVWDMHRRCVEFMPALKDAQIDFKEPVRVGLRPFRKQNVRLEREQDTSIIHNYGHGGAGVTLSWACAMDVVEIAKELVRDKNHPLK